MEQIRFGYGKMLFLVSMISVCSLWSMDDLGMGLGGPPGGQDVGFNTVVAGPSTSNNDGSQQTTSAPSSTQSDAEVLKKRFQEWYQYLAGYNPNTDGKTCYTNLLIQMLQYYWQFSKDTADGAASEGQGGSQSVPLTIQEALNGKQGDFFFMAFDENSYPIALVHAFKATALRYITQKFGQFDQHFYASDAAQNFINFRGNDPALLAGKKGELAQIDQAWNDLVKIIQTAFQSFQGSIPSGAKQLGSWAQERQKSLQLMVRDYQTIRDRTIVNWFYNLVTQLSVRYNEKNFSLNNYRFDMIPDAQALGVYAKLFQDALSRLADGTRELIVGPFSLTLGKKSDDSSGQTKASDKGGGGSSGQKTFTDTSGFITAVDNAISSKLGTISAFIGQVNLKKASELARGSQLPPAVKQPSPLYRNLEDIATYTTTENEQTGGTTNSVDDSAPLTAANITGYPGFLPLQENFQAVTNQLEKFMRSFGFDINNFQVWKKAESTTALAQLPLAPHDTNPKTAQEKAVKEVVAAQPEDQNFSENSQQDGSDSSSSDQSSNTASRIFNTLVAAARGYAMAGRYYDKAGQTLWAKSYTDRQNYVMAVLKYFQEAVVAFNKSSSAPQFAQSNSSTKTQGDYLLDAHKACGSAADTLELLQSPDLVIYVRKLSAQFAIQRYKSVTQGYVDYYKKWVGKYSEIAQKSPVLGDVNNSDTVRYQNYLDTIFSFFDSMLDGAIQSYKEELAFYFALNDPKSKENQEVISELQAVIQVFSNLQKAFAGIYHCIEDKDGKKVCAPTDSIGISLTCWLDATSENCLGADNYIETATTGSLADVIGWVLFANKKYLLAQPFFEKIDALFAQYQEALADYTPIESLVQSGGDEKITFSKFFYLHQARLYMTIGQRLQLGQNWQGDKIRGSSPVCIILYLWSKALYAQGGFSDQAQAVQKIIDNLIKSYPKEGAAFAAQAQKMQNQVPQQRDVESIKRYFDQIFTFYLTAYQLGDKDAATALLALLTDDQSQGQAAGAATSSGQLPSFVEWLNQNQSGLQFSQIDFARTFYRGYLVALSAGTGEPTTLLGNVNQAAQRIRSFWEQLYQAAQFDPNTKLTPEEYQKKVNAFQTLLAFDREIDALQLEAQLYLHMFGISSAQDLTTILAIKSVKEKLCKSNSCDLREFLGNLYKKSADELLLEQQKSFAAGQGLDSSDREVFQEIIERYKKAGEEYAQTGDQAAFVQTQLGVTNTVAFQSYSSLIPVYQFSVKGVDLSKGADTSSIPHRHCDQTTTVDDAMKTYQPHMPLYLFRYERQLIPTSIAQNAGAAGLVGKSDTASMKLMAQNIAVPLYQQALQEQANGSTDIKEYVTHYGEQLDLLLGQGVKACGNQVKATLSIEKETVGGDDSSQAHSGGSKESYFLVMENVPVIPLPRFSGELNTAYQLYDNGPFKLYGQGVNPISFAGRILLPSNNQAGQELVKEALLNTYLAQAVPIGAKIKALQASADYQKLKALSPADRLKASFVDYSDLYHSLQNEFTNLLSIYGALNQFVSTFGQSEGQAVINRLEAEAYLSWAQASVPFLVGDPTNQRFKTMVKTISGYVDQVTALEADPELTLSEEAVTTVAQALEGAAEGLSVMPIDPQVTAYPTEKDTYPVPVPDFSTFNNWNEAWNYCVIAQQIITKLTKAHKDYPFKKLDAALRSIRIKATIYLAKLGSYYLARFGYNAYEECKCRLTKKGATASQKNFFEEDSTWETVEVKKPGESANYPKYLYPASGKYPKVTFSKDSFGNTIRSCPSDGVPFAYLPQDSTSTIFQGVASIHKPSFQTILKSGQVGSEQASMSGFLSGSGSQQTGETLNDAYNIMKHDILHAIYYFEQAVTSLGPLVPPAETKTKDQLKSQEVPLEDLLQTQYIASIFSKNPAFATNYETRITKDGKHLPVIVVQAVQTKSGAKAVSRFVLIAPFVDQTKVLWRPLQLSSSQDIYPQTLQYWASNAVFGHDILDQLLKWIDTAAKATDVKTGQAYFSTAATWVNSLQYVARDFYWSTYLPGIDYQRAQTDINTSMDRLKKQSFIQASEYVG